MILILFIFVALWFASAGIQILFISEIKRDDDLSTLGIIVFLPVISLIFIVEGTEILFIKIANSKLTNLLFKKKN